MRPVIRLALLVACLAAVSCASVEGIPQQDREPGQAYSFGPEEALPDARPHPAPHRHESAPASARTR